MPARYVRALWETLHEPRIVTGSYVVLYTASVLAGVTIAVDARHGVLSGAQSWVVGVIVFLLVAGGAVGVTAAWRGDRWLERSVVIAVGLGVGLLLLNATWVAPEILPLTALLAAVTSAALVPRWMTVTSLTYAPGRGPTTPADDALLAHREG